jgi:hypothetical protein
VVQVGLNLFLAHILGMTFTMKENELANPENIGFFRLRAVMLLATSNSDLFEQARFLGFSRVTP